MIMITITRNNISTALLKKKKKRSKYNDDLRINNDFNNSYSDCQPCQFAPSAS